MFVRLDDFEGLWRIGREIRHADGARATLEGTARFAPHDAGLSYHETGWLCIAGQAPVQADRRYLWQPGAHGTITVAFEDGRAFHTIDLAHPEARHACAPDIYDVRYGFTGWPDWHSTWTVRGPRKNYRMTTQYRRA